MSTVSTVSMVRLSTTSPVETDVRGRISVVDAAGSPTEAQPVAEEDSAALAPEGPHSKMNYFLVFLLISHTWARSLPEDSVVSDYTTGTFNVYSQIANNLAERITQPIYRFFGVNTTTTKRPFEHIELLEPEPENTTKDREELSPDALNKPEKKPEKITLHNNYLPVKNNQEATLETPDIPEKINLFAESQKLEANDTITSDEIDDFDINIEDENDQETPRGTFVYFLELIGSILQLLWGGFLAIFKPSGSDSDRQ